MPHRPQLRAAIALLPALLSVQMATPRRQPVPSSPRTSEQFATAVRSAFVHAWRGYTTYAHGHDELKPLSRSPRNWYAQPFWRPQPLLMTPVDALDTMILMGLTDEAAATREYIATHLRFDRDIYVQGFEITIRLLGGLLSGYQLSGDSRLLALAEDLARRLLPMFDSPTGLPYRFVNLKTGRVRDPISTPADAGTLLLEFGTLSKLTGQPVFYDKAKRAIVGVYERRSAIGLVGTQINVETGQWVNTDSHIGGPIDSYYEYQLKCWLLFGDEDCRQMWITSAAAIRQYLADVRPRDGRRPESGLWYGRADMHTGVRTATTYGALDAYFAGVLALSGQLADARELHKSSRWMWELHGLPPEAFNYSTLTLQAPAYHLRPEIIESAYYLRQFATHAAGDTPDTYVDQGQRMFDDIVRYCRTGAGFAEIADVRTKELADVMPSFLFAETFKYLYLLGAPDALAFETVVFNTEAHPLMRTWH
jgi:mannosidase alpha-like ER degradation enhancer 2